MALFLFFDLILIYVVTQLLCFGFILISIFILFCSEETSDPEDIMWWEPSDFKTLSTPGSLSACTENRLLKNLILSLDNCFMATLALLILFFCLFSFLKILFCLILCRIIESLRATYLYFHKNLFLDHYFWTFHLYFTNPSCEYSLLLL